MEAHLRALSIWDRVAGVLSVVGALWMAGLGKGLFSGPFWSEIPLIVQAVVAGGSGILLYLIGHFLARYWNIARIAAGVIMALRMLGILSGLLKLESAFNLIGILINTAWTIAVLWALFNKRAAKICTENYRVFVSRTPQVVPPTFKSPFFWVPLILLGIMLILILLLFSMMFRVIQ